MMPPEFVSTDPCDVHLIDVSPPAASRAPEPFLYVSEQQLEDLGAFKSIPYRLAPQGNFQYPLYADSSVAAGDRALLDQALQIADVAMFEVLQANCTDQSGDGLVLGLTDENCCEVTTLFKADERLVEAFDWLRGRGYVQLGRDGLGEHIIVLRRLGE